MYVGRHGEPKRYAGKSRLMQGKETDIGKRRWSAVVVRGSGDFSFIRRSPPFVACLRPRCWVGTMPRQILQPCA